ncbi:hypothetical protein TEA_022128 [Camellia sinensis var. sinensis]|uniref:Uncharacterized protein n=1 Tax=Camellia sinensis var. sinensis TaxID=542762 RepID=A0A4S4D8X3_CAMSN|nr:hypothetical protein TEA_022128 [Camellia sinensis var. sinensis]
MHKGMQYHLWSRLLGRMTSTQSMTLGRSKHNLSWAWTTSQLDRTRPSCTPNLRCRHASIHLAEGYREIHAVNVREMIFIMINVSFDMIIGAYLLVSSLVDDDDLILLILNGLPDEYNALKTTVHARLDPISMDQLCSLLCSESIHVEASLKHMQAAEAPDLFAYNTH